MRVARIQVNGAGFKPVLLADKPGRVWHYGLIQEADGVRAVKFDKREADLAPDVLLKGQPYPIARAVKAFRATARRGRLYGNSLTKAAKAILYPGGQA